MVNMRRNREYPIETLEDMKAVLRKRFVPSYYYRQLYQKLQSLMQGNRSVDEYYQEMEIVMIRANVEEDRKATMARFMASLNTEIANIVELQHYVELEDMVHMAMKVERQLKRRGASRFGVATPLGSLSPWKVSGKNDEESEVQIKSKPIKKKEDMIDVGKGKLDSQNSKNSEVKCFKCIGKGI